MPVQVITDPGRWNNWISHPNVPSEQVPISYDRPDLPQKGCSYYNKGRVCPRENSPEGCAYLHDPNRRNTVMKHRKAEAQKKKNGPGVVASRATLQEHYQKDAGEERGSSETTALMLGSSNQSLVAASPILSTVGESERNHGTELCRSWIYGHRCKKQPCPYLHDLVARGITTRERNAKKNASRHVRNVQPSQVTASRQVPPTHVEKPKPQDNSVMPVRATSSQVTPDDGHEKTGKVRSQAQRLPNLEKNAQPLDQSLDQSAKSKSVFTANFEATATCHRTLKDGDISQTGQAPTQRRPPTSEIKSQVLQECQKMMNLKTGKLHGKSSTPCGFMLQHGHCKRGDNCWFSHIIPTPSNLEKRGSARAGLEGSSKPAQALLDEQAIVIHPVNLDKLNTSSSKLPEKENRAFPSLTTTKTLQSNNCKFIPKDSSTINTRTSKPPSNKSTIKITRYRRQIDPVQIEQAHASPVLPVTNDPMYSVVAKLPEESSLSAAQFPVIESRSAPHTPAASTNADLEQKVLSDPGLSWDPIATNWVNWAKANLAPDTFEKYFKKYREYANQAQLPPAVLRPDHETPDDTQFTCFEEFPQEIKDLIWKFACLNDANTCRVRLHHSKNKAGEIQKTLLPCDPLPPFLRSVCSDLRKVALTTYGRGFRTRENGEAMLYYKFYKDRLFINGAPGQFLEVAELMYKADKERIRKLAVSLKEFIGGRRNFHDRTREDFAEAITHFPYVKGVYLFIGNIIDDTEVAGDHKRLVRKIRKNNEATWKRKWGSRQQPEYFIEVIDPFLAKAWNIDNLLWAGQSNDGWEEGPLQTMTFRPIGS